MPLNLTEPMRAWIYRVLVAAVALAGAYGVVSGSDAMLWVGLISAILGLPLAVANTTTKPD